jgi:hypothetical protein
MCCRVYWHNPKTGGLDHCVAKSFNSGTSSPDASAFAVWREIALQEAEALKRMDGVWGVPRFLNIVQEPEGATHIIME